VANDVERVLADIDADDGDGSLGGLGGAPCRGCPLPALIADGAGTRPVHPISRHRPASHVAVAKPVSASIKALN
jgi:hypothetical protein